MAGDDIKDERPEAEIAMDRLRALTTPTAILLAENFLLANDLKASFLAMKLWFEKYSGREEYTEEDRIISGSLFRDSVVQFVGCFDTSAKAHVSPDIYASRDGAPEFFQWLKDVRDSYAAHKFGPLRQCAVGPVVDDSGKVLGT